MSDTPLESTTAPRCALRGSLDPTTGIFYRAPEHHTRIRTVQACDKCRIRKAKCSGDHPVCERCRIRGLVCRYAPERRTRRWGRAEREDGSGRASRLSDDARPRSKSGMPTSHVSPCSTADVERPGSGHGQRAGDRARSDAVGTPRRATTAEDEDASERSFSQRVPDHPLAGSVDDDDLGTPRVGENALALCFDPYTGDPGRLTPRSLEAAGDDVSRVILADHDPAWGLTGATYPESVLLFHHPPRAHRSGSRFDVDLGAISGNDAESPGRTPSTSSSASPILTRASSDGLPTTPTSSYPNSPYALASLSPHLGPGLFASDPHAYPLFTSGVRSMDMGTDGGHHHHHHGGGGGGGEVLTEYVAWREVKDGARACGGLFLDTDAVF